MIVRMRVLDGFRRAPRDPGLALHQVRFLGDLFDRAAGGHGFCLFGVAAALGVHVFPNAANVFSDIGLRDLAFFHDDVPVGAVFAPKDVVYVVPVGLLIFEAAVFLDELYESFFKHGVRHSCISFSSSASDFPEISPAR